jgi:hypothetical protein
VVVAVIMMVSFAVYHDVPGCRRLRECAKRNDIPQRDTLKELIRRPGYRQFAQVILAFTGIEDRPGHFRDIIGVEMQFPNFV